MSDYNSTGWATIYEREAKARNYEGREDIHSWDSEGTALIVDRRTGALGLRRARCPRSQLIRGA
ncbi:MAG TPA: hypothetical protein VFG33_13400 [Kribbella sp.]|uniref:hypothetical protein n=1 Tax=Kribbella sp. TaxID=1871183 RepID=UPI002D76DEAC|nr:hypothetical protein [Kribbella sp.]HET6294373.1 hypothetical protein [Kribbella sp.]